MNKNTLRKKIAKRSIWGKSLFALLSIGIVSLSNTSMNAQNIGTYQIGSGTNTINGGTAMPVTNYDYTYSQQIIKASEISNAGGVAGNITKIKYYVKTVGTVSVWDTWTVYMGNTLKDAFASESDYIPLGELTNVYSGTITAVNESWMEVTLTTPFNYTGGNLVVAVHETKAGWNTAPTFYSYNSTNSGILFRRDTSVIDPSNIPTGTTNKYRVSSVPQLRFEGAIANCLPTTQSSASSVSFYSATLSWAGEVTNSYEVNWGTGTFVGGAGANTELVDGSTTLNLSNLSDNTTYRYFVKTICDENSESGWAGPYTFTTQLAPYTTPWLYEFATTNTGWDLTGAYSLPSTWTNPFTDANGTYIYSNPYSTYNRSVVTPLVGPILAGDAISFDYAQKPYGSGDVANGTTIVSVSTDGGTTYQEVGNFSHNGTVTWQSSSYFDLSDYVGEIIKIKVNTIPSSGADFYFGIDNFRVSEEPSCLSPNSLSNGQLSLTSTTLDWEGNATDYQLVWGNQGFDHLTSTPIDVSATTFLLENLITDENYQFYVRTNCTADENGYSDWTGPFNFRVGYCTSIPTSYDGDGITSVTIGSTTFSVEEGSYYFHNTPVIVETGSITSSVIFNTGYTYDTHIWIDFDNDGVFNNTNEKVFSGMSTSGTPTTLLTSFTIPANTNSGQYRMRIGTADSGQATPDPCYSESWGVTVDVLLNITDNEPCNTAAPTGSATQTLVSGQTLADLAVTGTSITWYSDAALTTAIPVSTIAVNGTTYYATQTIDSCESETALAVTVTVEEPCNTAAPTGDSVQSLSQGQTLADLQVTGTNLKWYSDSALMNEIASTTVATTGTTYYVTQTIDSCESTSALAITVDVALDNNSLDIVDLKVYPNPTKDVLHIDYKSAISKVTIFDINGRQVDSYVLNAATNKISVYALSSGTYLLKVETETNETSIVKFIKK